VAWFRVARGRLEYSGRLTRHAFTKWCATRDGREAVARAARGIRFSLLGRSRSARRRLWRAFDAAMHTEDVAAALRAEASRYMQVVARLCYVDALPRAHVALHRLVLTPRAMIAGRAHAGVCDRLSRIPAIAGLDEGVRRFLLDQLVTEMDAALWNARPSPQRPIEAADGWVCVGIRRGTIWTDSLWAGPDGTGHVFMYEFPRTGLTRRDRKTVESAIEQLSAAVSSLSRADRAAMLRAVSLRQS